MRPSTGDEEMSSSMHLIDDNEFRVVAAIRRYVDKRVEAEVQRRLQAARDALVAAYEPSQDEVLQEALRQFDGHRVITVTGPEHLYEELPIPNPLDGLSFMDDIPGEMHVPAQAREMTLADWLDAPARNTTARTIEDVVTGESSPRNGQGNPGHVGRTIHPGPRSQGEWIPGHLGQAMAWVGLTPQDVATRLHVTDRAVRQWMQGKYVPSAGHREALCNLLGVDL